MGPRVAILVTVWMVLVALWGCGGEALPDGLNRPGPWADLPDQLK